MLVEYYCQNSFTAVSLLLNVCLPLTIIVYHFRNKNTGNILKNVENYGNSCRNRVRFLKWTGQYRLRRNVSDSQRFGHPEEAHVLEQKTKLKSQFENME